MNAKAHAGPFSPHMEIFEGCTSTTVASAGQLKEDSTSSELYYMRVRPEGDSTDERMLRRLDMSGAIFAFPIAANTPSLTDEAEVLFTGRVYKRRPSLPQRFLGGARDELFYGVELLGERALLSASAFHSPPVTICDEALGR